MNYSTTTCGLIVSYNPGEQIIQSIKELVKQVDKVIIVDNGSLESAITEHLRSLDSTGIVKILYNQKNLGIAHALNQGINIAIQENFEWIVTFDQDTAIPTTFISSLFNCYDKIQLKQDIAILCPIYLNSFIQSVTDNSSKYYEYVKSAMTSGSLMKISAIKEIGLFDEKLFIDWVDHDYCVRTRLSKYRIVESTHTHLIHVPGNVSENFIFGTKICTSNHSPLRRYYMYRNRIIYLKRYFLVDSIFILQDLLTGLKDALKIALLEEQKKDKLIMVCVGIKDGIFNKLGVYQKRNNEAP